MDLKPVILFFLILPSLSKSQKFFHELTSKSHINLFAAILIFAPLISYGCRVYLFLTDKYSSLVFEPETSFPNFLHMFEPVSKVFTNQFTDLFNKYGLYSFLLDVIIGSRF